MTARSTAARGMGLTPKARALLVYLSNCEFCPSYREMREVVGLSSSGVQRLVAQLEERGYIRRLPNRARAIEVLVPAATRMLHVIYGPGHWEDRARLNRAEYAREAA